MPLSFAPGEAYQFDWSHEVILMSGVTVTVKVAHVRLCHSRMMFIRAYPRETQEMVFDAHERAFAFFKGACTRVTQLNAEGARFRGKQFSTSNVHRILTDETHTGTHWFNVKDSKTGKVRPRSDWVAMEAPVIIDPAMFDRVRARRADHHPRNTPPRVVTGPILLSGLAECAACGAGMTLRTGKSNRYRYYACAGRAQKGPTKCEGCAIPMDALDKTVLDQVADRVFQPDRLNDLLAGFLDQSRDAEHERRQRVGRLKAELTETEGAVQKLLTLVEKGHMDMDDPALAERLRQHRANRQVPLARCRSLRRRSIAYQQPCATLSRPAQPSSVAPMFGCSFIEWSSADVKSGFRGRKQPWPRQPPLMCLRPGQKFLVLFGSGVPYGIRTRVAAVRGQFSNANRRMMGSSVACRRNQVNPYEFSALARIPAGFCCPDFEPWKHSGSSREPVPLPVRDRWGRDPEPARERSVC